jgi:hypothetical protein
LRCPEWSIEDALAGTLEERPLTSTAELIPLVQEALRPLIGVHLDVLRLPRHALEGFEPSQVGTIVGTLVDACVPALDKLYPNLGGLGLRKAPGILGNREGYPDFEHGTGARLELKMLYVDPIGIQMKAPPTPREPSARITQKVTVRNVQKDRDLLWLLVYQLQPAVADSETFSPRFIDVGLFSMAECVEARDQRLIESGGKWFGDYQTPAILSGKGKVKISEGRALNSEYGRKENEGKDYNEDTNFGKLKRIPLRSLQEFLKKHGCDYMSSGTYPRQWRIRE